jgi:hypothetical protein
MGQEKRSALYAMLDNTTSAVFGHQGGSMECHID